MMETSGVAHLDLLFPVLAFSAPDGRRNVSGVQIEEASACNGEDRVHPEEFAVPQHQREECLPVLGFRMAGMGIV